MAIDFTLLPQSTHGQRVIHSSVQHHHKERHALCYSGKGETRDNHPPQADPEANACNQVKGPLGKSIVHPACLDWWYVRKSSIWATRHSRRSERKLAGERRRVTTLRTHGIGRDPSIHTQGVKLVHTWKHRRRTTGQGVTTDRAIQPVERRRNDRHPRHRQGGKLERWHSQDSHLWA